MTPFTRALAIVYDSGPVPTIKTVKHPLDGGSRSHLHTLVVGRHLTSPVSCVVLAIEESASLPRPTAEFLIGAGVDLVRTTIAGGASTLVRSVVFDAVLVTLSNRTRERGLRPELALIAELRTGSPVRVAIVSEGRLAPIERTLVHDLGAFDVRAPALHHLQPRIQLLEYLTASPNPAIPTSQVT